eukprot:12505937-Ditylum_brightwellii.AAC.1
MAEDCQPPHQLVQSAKWTGGQEVCHHPDSQICQHPRTTLELGAGDSVHHCGIANHTVHSTVQGHPRPDIKAHEPVGGRPPCRAGGGHSHLSYGAGGATAHTGGGGREEGQIVQRYSAVWMPPPSSLSGNSTGPGGSVVPQGQLHQDRTA